MLYWPKIKWWYICLSVDCSILLYANGLGGSQNLVQAYMWYSLAAGNGYEIATGYRNDLAKQMTPAQIAEAQQLAREWKPLKK